MPIWKGSDPAARQRSHLFTSQTLPGIFVYSITDDKEKGKGEFEKCKKIEVNKWDTIDKNISFVRFDNF